MQEELNAWNARAALDWEISRLYASSGNLDASLGKEIEEARTHYSVTFDQIKDMFYRTGKNQILPPYPISIELWIDMASQVTMSLLALKDMALEKTDLYLRELERQAKESIIINLLLFGSALTISFYSWWVITRRVIRPVNTMVDSLYREAHILNRETHNDVPNLASLTMQKEDEVGKLSVVLEAFRANVREIERASEERLRYMKSLEDSNRELDDFAYIASHDLKEPLRGLHNFSRFLIEDYNDRLDNEGRNMLYTIADLTKRMDELLSSLLHYSRLGRTELSVRKTDLDEVARNAIIMHSVKIKESNARVEIIGKLPSVVCDGVRIAEVFKNLLVNALKYNDKENKTVEIGCTENHPDHVGETVFFVRDNGIGIEQKNLDTVFKIFRRLHAQDAYGGGTGSGLTIARKIILQHGGNIWAESAGKGQGTVFYFTIPEQKKEGGGRKAA